MSLTLWVLSISALLTEFIARADAAPSFGFNLPPLGIDGKSIDYRDTSPRFFAGISWFAEHLKKHIR
jgi:hypothetical protein